ncbi:MAG: hypothetical protein RSE97_08330 [Oscillospiraceae bacterium]
MFIRRVDEQHEYDRSAEVSKAERWFFWGLTLNLSLFLINRNMVA